MDADPPEADPGSGALSRIEEDPTVSDSAEPEEPCRVQARVLVTPLDGETAAGHLTLADWEVSAR